MPRNWLALVFVLGLLCPGATRAKPPDLPLESDDRVAQVVAEATPLTPAVAPIPADPTAPHLLPSVRKQVVACLLFAAHPLMPLVPTDKALDRPCDHPAPHAALEPGTVLGNLTKLAEADGWVRVGEWNLASGKLADAVECFEKAMACCPGSPLAHRAEAAIQRVYARVYRQSIGNIEEAEPKPTMPTEPCPCPCPCPGQCPCPRNNMPKSEPQPCPAGPGGATKLEVPLMPLILRIEQQGASKGGEEESEEPMWFLPWLDEWNVPGNEA